MDVRNKVLHVEKEIKAVQNEILEAGEVTKKLTFMIVVFFFVVLSESQKSTSDLDAYVWQNLILLHSSSIVHLVHAWLEITVSKFGNNLLPNRYS